MAEILIEPQQMKKVCPHCFATIGFTYKDIVSKVKGTARTRSHQKYVNCPACSVDFCVEDVIYSMRNG